MSGKISPGRDPEIEGLLRDYNPSELDEAVRTVCPFYEPEDRQFTGAYLDFHEYAKVGILTRLQLRLEELRVCSEDETASGRVDGSVYSLGMEGGNVFLYDDGKPAERVALVEVKTGNLKPLQAAAYAHTEGKPTIIAEVKRGICHLMDQETADKLLRYAQEQLTALGELRRRSQRIPDSYRCSSCADDSCEYWDERGSGPEARFVIRNRTEQLDSNLAQTVDELVDIVEDLLKKRGLRAEEREDG